MSRRRLIAVIAVVVLAVVAAAVVALLRGGDGDTRAVGDPLAEALAYAPASAPVVAVVQTDGDEGQGKALGDLAARYPAARIAAGQLETRLGPLVGMLGNPVVVWGEALELARATAVLVSPDRDKLDEVLAGLRKTGGLYRSGDLYLGVRGLVVVASRDPARVRQAFDTRARRVDGLTRTAFRRRLGPLAAGDSLVQIAAAPQALLAGAGGAGLPFARALRRAAVTVRVARPGLRVRFRLTTDPRRVRPADVPLAAGPRPPRPASGDAPTTIAIRDLRRTLDVLERTDARTGIPAIDAIDQALQQLQRVRGPLKTFGRIDVDHALLDQLTGTTTITREDGGGTSIRAELRDGDALRSALRRISLVPDFALDAAGADDFDLDRRGDDAYTYVAGDRTLVRLAVLDNLLVATTDPGVGLRALANRRPRVASGPGALAATITGPAVVDLVVARLGLPPAARFLLGGLGPLNARAQASVRGLEGEATVAIVP